MPRRREFGVPSPLHDPEGVGATHSASRDPVEKAEFEVYGAVTE
jgi:hypothetical protein